MAGQLVQQLGPWLEVQGCESPHHIADVLGAEAGQALTHRHCQRLQQLPKWHTQLSAGSVACMQV